MKRRKPKPAPLDWEGRIDGTWVATFHKFALLVNRAGTRWAWSVTAPGESAYHSPDGIRTAYGREAAMNKAERAARRRVAEAERKKKRR